MKNDVKKLNWVLPNVTSKIRTKSIRPMVCTLNDCFCRQKAKNEFYPKYEFCWRIICYYHYLTHSSALPAAVMKLVLLHLEQGFSGCSSINTAKYFLDKNWNDRKKQKTHITCEFWRSTGWRHSCCFLHALANQLKGLQWR